MGAFAGNEKLTLKIVSLCVRVKGILTDLPSDMSGRVFYVHFDALGPMEKGNQEGMGQINLFPWPQA